MALPEFKGNTDFSTSFFASSPSHLEAEITLRLPTPGFLDGSDVGEGSDHYPSQHHLKHPEDVTAHPTILMVIGGGGFRKQKHYLSTFYISSQLYSSS